MRAPSWVAFLGQMPANGTMTRRLPSGPNAGGLHSEVPYPQACFLNGGQGWLGSPNAAVGPDLAL